MPDSTPGRWLDIDRLLEQAAQQVADTEKDALSIQDKFHTVAAVADHAATFGLLPLGLACLIFHELYTSAAENRPFRVHMVLLRLGVVSALILGYGWLVRLITGVAGAGSNWITTEQMLGWADDGASYVSAKFTGVTAIGKFFFWLQIYFILLICSLLALAVGKLIAISQGLLIAILLALGKTAIAVSLCPGVGLGKSWARMLAMVSAWSTVGGVIVSMLVVNQVHLRYYFIQGDVMNVLLMGVKYIILACFVGAIPWITSALFNGVAAMAPGIATPMGVALKGLKMLAGPKGLAAGAAGAALGKLAGAATGKGADGGAGGASRPHKAARIPLGGAGEMVRAGQRSFEGAAARAYKARNALPASKPAVPPRVGAPGAAHWRDVAPASAQASHAAAATAPAARTPRVPAANDEMAARVAENHDTLRAAYPEKIFDPVNLTPEERGIVAELDDASGRFAGWDRGRQGTYDFAEAEARAQHRVANGGTAPPAYQAPRSDAAPAASLAKHDAHRLSQPYGPAGVGDVVVPNAAGQRPDPDRLVPAAFHRVEAPAGLGGDRRGNAEYWSWREGDPATDDAREQRAAHAQWTEQRAQELSPATAAQQWHDYQRTSQYRGLAPLERARKQTWQRGSAKDDPAALAHRPAVVMDAAPAPAPVARPQPNPQPASPPASPADPAPKD